MGAAGKTRRPVKSKRHGGAPVKVAVAEVLRCTARGLSDALPTMVTPCIQKEAQPQI